MAKQYKTWELIKAWQEGERGEFTSRLAAVELTDEKIKLRGGNSLSYYFISAYDKTATWTKVQTPVDFMTAVNSGKRIRPNNSCYGYMNLKDILCMLASLPESKAVSLINGEWLIEED